MLCFPIVPAVDTADPYFTASGTLLVPRARTATGQRSFAINGPRTWNNLPADLRTPDDPLLLQASSQGPPVSAVVYASAGRWAQHRSSGAVVTVQRLRRPLQIFRLTYLLTYLLLSSTPPFGICVVTINNGEHCAVLLLADCLSVCM